MPTASPAVAAAPTPAAPANVPATSPAVGASAAAPSARPPEGSAHALSGNGHLALLRCHGRRLLNGLRRAALHLLRALPRLVQEALHVTGPADDLRWRLRLRPWAGQCI